MHVVLSERFAGVEQFIRRLAVAQSRAGHDVIVIGGPPAEMSATLWEDGVRHYPASSLLAVVSAVRRLSTGCDIVNSHMTAADMAVVIGTVANPLPALVSTRHFQRRRGSRGPGLVYRLIERRIDAELSISDAVAQAAGVRSIVVHSGVDTAPEVRTDREPIVLMAQRLQPEKHSLVGVRAFAESGLADRGWTLHVAGSGPDEDAMRAEATRLGVDRAVVFLGFRSDMSDLYSRASLLIAPCPTEGLGLTVLEAMATGLPVIAADAGGHKELLAGTDHRTRFPADDVNTAGARLRALATDPLGRTALGGALRDRQRAEFSLEGQVAGTDEVYRTAILRSRVRRLK